VHHPSVRKDERSPIPADELRAALKVIGLEFSDDELELMGRRAAIQRHAYERSREAQVPWDLAPSLRFDPRIRGVARRPSRVQPGRPAIPEPAPARPPDLDALAYASIAELAALIRSRSVSCLELAQASLDRLRRLDPALVCVVTYLDERALRQAAQLDRELDEGRWRGPLHGIPWGAKDLLSVRGAPTTWGSPPFADQFIDEDATVVERLDAAGAVLVAKLSLGELAMDDVWTGGRTRNPWDPSEGSSGSSAGSAAATAAGAVAFAIGSETLGSIISPCAVCGCTGLRPSFGRVSRHGAMPLAWSMDKLGPICRSAADAAIIFEAIVGPDGHDETVAHVPFAYPAALDVSAWRVGVDERAFDRHPELRPGLQELIGLGARTVAIELPETPVSHWLPILEAEAASAFDDLTRDGRVRSMVRQDADAWPTAFRAARLIPAVEWLRLDRRRRALMLETAAVLDEADVDLVVHPTRDDLLVTLENLVGYPAVALPWGRRANGAPDSLTIMGRLDGEADLLAFAMAWQERTEHHRRHPAL
jgi:Asp-tRNA(Asn)/Glu-tRNA(Gln) amidotransferase A subunit family amidase